MKEVKFEIWLSTENRMHGMRTRRKYLRVFHHSPLTLTFWCEFAVCSSPFFLCFTFDMSSSRCVTSLFTFSQRTCRRAQNDQQSSVWWTIEDWNLNIWSIYSCGWSVVQGERRNSRDLIYFCYLLRPSLRLLCHLNLSLSRFNLTHNSRALPRSET